MIVTTPAGRKIKIIHRIKDISLNKGAQILSLIHTNPDLNIASKKSIIYELSDTSLDVVSSFTDESINNIWSYLQFKDLTHSECTIFNTLNINNKLFGLTDLEKLTVREYEQATFFLSEGESEFDYLSSFVSTLFRPINSSVKNKSFKSLLNNKLLSILYSKKSMSPRIFKSYTLEQLNEYTEENSDLLGSHLDLSFGIGVYTMFNDLQRRLLKEYSLIFPTKEKDEFEIEETKDLDFEDIWGIYHIIQTISKDIFERDEWLNRPIRELFKYLTYLKQKSLYDGKQ